MVERAIEESKIEMYKFRRRIVIPQFQLQVEEEGLIANDDMLNGDKTILKNLLREKSVKKTGQVKLDTFLR